jgi:DNA-binding NarL/FixJ family response regulator
MSPDDPARVLLCDDARELRALLRSALDAPDVRVVGEAADGDDALRLAAATQPDVVVVDLHMPGPPADALLRALPKAAPGAAIVTYSGADPQTLAGGPAAVVALHVPKTTELHVVRDRVRELARRVITARSRPRG